MAKIPFTCQLEQNWKLATNTSEKKKKSNFLQIQHKDDHRQDGTLSNQTHLGTGFAELLDLGYVVCREGGLNILAHLLHVTGDQHGPATQGRGSQLNPQQRYVLLVYKLSQNVGAENSAELSAHEPQRGWTAYNRLWEGGTPRLGHRTADPYLKVPEV